MTQDTSARKKSDRTRMKIAQAFLALMHEKQFQEIKVKAVVERAGIQRGTFYLYYSDLSELMTTIEEEILNGLPAPPAEPSVIVNPSSPPSYDLCSDHTWETAWFCYYSEHHEAMNALLGPNGDPSFLEKIRKHMQDALLLKMKRDHMPEDQYMHYFISQLPDIYLMLARSWTIDPNFAGLTLDEMVSIAGTIRTGSIYMRYLERTRETPS